MKALSKLWPCPKHCVALEESFRLPKTLAIASRVGDAARHPLARLADKLRRLGFEPHPAEGPEAAFRFGLDPGALAPRGYRLRVESSGVTLEGADEAGLFAAVATLGQWLELHTPHTSSSELPGLEVVDHPDFAHRGAMLDVSRNKVPTMATLFGLVERLAGFKLNQLQLYTEHTFAYRGHEKVWRGWSPLTPEEIRELDAFCHTRGIELVPNQNSFGHFHRWLIHEPYRQLAECPEGISHPFSPEPEPFSLCPTDPGSLEHLADLYDQLLPNFKSRMLNAGLDETLDLGQGRSAGVSAERGVGRVYLDFLKEVHRLARERGHRLQFWGDVILNHPELLAELPRDAIALEWGYEADHPFESDGARFAASGLDFYVCPGTSGWNSLAGRTTNALGNLGAAARAGRAGGALGYLITDWGDHGHLQPLPVSWAGLLGGAGLAWNADAELERETAAGLLDRWVFQDREHAAGRAFLDLGDTYRLTGSEHPNGSALFFLLVFPHYPLDHERLRGLDRAGLEEILERVDTAIVSGRRARMACADAELVSRELEWVADALRIAARLGLERLHLGGPGELASLPEPIRRRAARDLRALGERLSEIWLERNRPGGLTASRAKLETALSILDL